MRYIFSIFLISTLLFANESAKSRFEFSFKDVSGNEERRAFRVKLKTEKRVKDDIFYIDISSLYSKHYDESNADKAYLKFKGKKYFSEKFSTFLEANYLKDELGGYDYRINFGPGVGYKFFDFKSWNLESSLSILISKDRLLDSEKSRYRSLQSEVIYNWDINSLFRVEEELSYEFSFLDSEKYFLNSVSGLYFRVTESFSLALKYRLSYKNFILDTDSERTDRVLYSLLVIEF